jgi:hypothetical protein
MSILIPEKNNPIQSAGSESTKSNRIQTQSKEFFHLWRHSNRIWKPGTKNFRSVSLPAHYQKFNTDFNTVLVVGDPGHFCVDPDPRIRTSWLMDLDPLLSSVTFKNAKKLFFRNFSWKLPAGTLSSGLKIKFFAIVFKFYFASILISPLWEKGRVQIHTSVWWIRIWEAQKHADLGVPKTCDPAPDP